MGIVILYFKYVNNCVRATYYGHGGKWISKRQGNVDSINSKGENYSCELMLMALRLFIDRKYYWIIDSLKYIKEHKKSN